MMRMITRMMPNIEPRIKAGRFPLFNGKFWVEFMSSGGAGVDRPEE